MIRYNSRHIQLQDFLFRATATVILSAGLMGGTDANAACPSSGFTSSANTLNLTGNCIIAGNVDLSGSAALTMTGGILTIEGNVVLNGNSSLTVTSGSITFPQTNYSQYTITLNGNSKLNVSYSTLTTNAKHQHNFSMSLQANDVSVVNFVNSNLNTDTGSWLLGNFSSHSKLNMINSQNLPTEIYPTDASQISISGSSLAGVWLNFLSGSNGAVNIPTQNSQGNYSFSFGPGTGIGYSVNISDSRGRIGLNSYPNSTMIVNGHGTSGATDANVVFGYYVQNNTGPVSINGLNGGDNITRRFTDQGRDLQLNHVNLNPFAWQVYVSQSNNYLVSINNSTINEIGVLTNGVVDISNTTLQLAITGAFGPGSILNINNTQIWTQAIQAENGGQVVINNSDLYGNFVSATGAGSSIVMLNVGDNPNGVSPQSCTPVDGYPPNNNGVPLCNPYNPLYQCVQVIPPIGGAKIGSTPKLAC